LSLSPEARGGSIFLKSLHGNLASICNHFSQLVFFFRFLAYQSSKARVSVTMLSGNLDAPYITQKLIINFQIEAVF
jgi:hypothetical protein